MDLINLTLILIGTVSINFSTCNGDTTCKGVNSGVVLGTTTCFGSWFK